jgi:galactose-1-phosphate uridylyltransferase
MTPTEKLYQTLPDGTLKHIHPISGVEVWTVPSRAHRPIRKAALAVRPITPAPRENYCDFCAASYLKTPPEKSRLIQKANSAYERIDQLSPDLFDTSEAVFRRVANLFEIVTLDYWMKNHGYKPSPDQLRRQQNYLKNPLGHSHVLKVVETKLAFSGFTPEEIARLSDGEKISMGEAFFLGSHDLIIAGRHYIPGAQRDNQYFSSGEMSPEEHHQFFRFTLDALMDLQAQNPLLRYVCVFQNWLQPAGASLNHLHKQLVGMDEWGTSVEQAVRAAKEKPDIYNELIINFARERGLILAENEHAIALCEWGHRYPTLAVYSKSVKIRPEEHSNEELKGVSDMVQACHAATGSQTPCNEEWTYAPRDSTIAIPWHIFIKWRTINQAGFEGGTKIYINPLSPEALRDQITPALLELRKSGKIGDMRIAGECKAKASPLRYND